MRLANKLAVITAATSGMGRKGVETFLREGARVAAIDTNKDALVALKDAAAANGHDLVTIEADLATTGGARGSIHRAAVALGGIDVLWAHAGNPGPALPEDFDLPAYELSTTLNIASEVAKYMRIRGGGSLIFTSSASNIMGSMFSLIYSTAKFAVVGLGKSLALQYGPSRIRVNVLCPGLAETPMMNGVISTGDESEACNENDARFLAAIPLGRLPLAQEIADAALWLASDESTYVTGVALPIDGGYSAQQTVRREN